ncbi:hypothetical protein EV122DRAFT_222588 [Schizophyllum commune]
MYSTTPPRKLKRTASTLTPGATTYAKRLRTTSAPAYYGKPSEAPRLLAGPDEAGLALMRRELESASPKKCHGLRKSNSYLSASDLTDFDSEYDFPPSRQYGLKRSSSFYSERSDFGSEFDFPPRSEFGSEYDFPPSSSAPLWRELIDSQPPVISEISARTHLQPTGTSFDYSLPPGFDASLPIPLACTASDVVLFPRKNRIYGKALTAATAPSQLAKIPEKYGGLTLLAAAGADYPHLFAAATRRNQIYVYDVNKPNEPVTWFGAGAEVGAMAWNHAVLTVGDGKGRIRHYDTRITPANRMREQARRLMRHQAKVTALGYHRLGNKLASGDAAGNVFVWDIRNQDTSPMDVGEFVLRRKKIQHEAPISSISWSPFDSQTFVTGDTSGIIRRWDVTDNTSSKDNSCLPKITDHKRAVLALMHAPSGCRELLSVHSGPSLHSGGPIEDRRHLASLAGGSSLPSSSSQPSPLDARDPWTHSSTSTSTSPLDPSPSWIDPAIATSLAASRSISATISTSTSISTSAAPLDRTSRPDTANAIVVHTGNMKKYLGTVPVAARPLGAAALASGGRRIVFAVEDVDRAPETDQESAVTHATAVPRMDASANASASADTTTGEAADRDASSADPSAAPDSEKEQARNGIRKGRIEVWTCWGKQRAEPRRTMSMILR